MTICNINEFLIEISKNNKLILCLDIGSKRTGIAFSDPNKKFSLPSKTINNIKSDSYKQLVSIVNEYNIGAIVIGIPLNYDGTENKKCQSIKDITKHLDFIFSGNNINIPIVFWDESYSSEKALDKIKNIVDTKIKQKKKLIDKFAAKEILQDFLNYRINLINEKKNKPTT
tara:strand:- start:454 stop:966 length:513 start_codon:yes stop_codon:yes gene_type:complete